MVPSLEVPLLAALTVPAPRGTPAGHTAPVDSDRLEASLSPSQEPSHKRQH